MPENHIELEKTLRPLDAVMIVVGNVVGVGIFTTTGFIAGDLPDARMVMAVWLLGGLLTLLGALSYGELGAAFPRAGGDYVYLREAYGPLAGFLVGWVGFFIINPGSIAALALGFTEYLIPLAGYEAKTLTPAITKTVAVCAILVFSTINTLSVRWASRAQNLVAGLSLLTILGIVCAGFSMGAGQWSHFSARSGSASWGQLFGPAMISVFFTYSGWFVAAYVASEMKDAQRTLPLSLIVSSIVVMLLYIAVNAFYIYALPLSAMAGVVDIGRRASETLLGARASVFVSVMVLLAILSSLNSAILTAPRIYFAMARDGLFPKALASVHPRYRTPHHAIGLQAAVSCLMVLAGNFYQLLSYTVFFMLLTSIATAAGVLVLRWRHPLLKRPYRVWGYPVTTLLFVLSYAWIAVRIFLYNPWNAMIGLLITLTGAPFYLVWAKKRQQLGTVTSCLLAFLLAGMFAMPTAACAHGIVHQITQKEAVLVSAEYDDGEPMSYADVKIFAPGEGKIAHQTGRTDKNGCFAFLPDSQGQWKIILDGGMGHLVETSFTVRETLRIDETKTGGKSVSQWQGILVGVGVIFGMTGFAYGLSVRRSRQPQRSASG